MKKTLFTAFLASVLLAQPVYAQGTFPAQYPTQYDYANTDTAAGEYSEAMCRSIALAQYTGMVSGLSGKTEKQMLAAVNAIAKFKKGSIEDKKLKPMMRQRAKEAFAESKHAQSASERKAMLNGLKRNRDAMIEQLTQRCFQGMNQ